MAKRPGSPLEGPLTFLKCGFTEDELEALILMMRASGAATFASVIRQALWRYGEHLQCGLPLNMFRLSRDDYKPRIEPEELSVLREDPQPDREPARRRARPAAKRKRRARPKS